MCHMHRISTLKIYDIAPRGRILRVTGGALGGGALLKRLCKKEIDQKVLAWKSLLKAHDHTKL